MARKTPTEQDKYDALLLDTVKTVHRKVDSSLTELAKQGVELKNNTRETVRLTKEVKETNGNVRELQGHVSIVEGEVVTLKKKVFPDEPSNPSELQSVWSDPLIRKIIFIVGSIIILAAIGFSNDEIRGLFNG